MQNVFLDSQVQLPILTLAVPQNRDRQAISDVFSKALRLQALSAGLSYFLRQTFDKGYNEQGDLGKFIQWASGVAVETLRTTVNLDDR